MYKKFYLKINGEKSNPTQESFLPYKIKQDKTSKNSRKPSCGSLCFKDSRRASVQRNQKRLSGIPRLRPRKYSRLAKTDVSISRPYGGVLDHSAVRDRIVRAFLTEEIKVIKKKIQQKKAK